MHSSKVKKFSLFSSEFPVVVALCEFENYRGKKTVAVDITRFLLKLMRYKQRTEPKAQINI